ncbi:S9 family peptidase [Empedobacter sp. UBA7620]|uniref:S9 family peptidase n=1 Tax=Empedobacter sp. UBA7620 TaxID=1946452 RepID=UPI0025BC5F74|nr:YqiA/YcfP family alpha/beta fold hydrolase [Empedobacter sp. UBA7620]
MAIKNNITIMYKIIYTTSFFLLLLILSIEKVNGQTDTKKVYSESLNDRWSESSVIINSTKNGNWILIREDFRNKSTHYLIHQKRKIKIEISLLLTSEFSTDEKWFAYYTSNKEIKVINLLNLSNKTFNNISSHVFSFDNNSRFIAFYQTNEKKSLIIYNLQNDSTNEFIDVSDFRWNPKGDKVAMIVNNPNLSDVRIYNLDHNSVKVIQSFDHTNLSLLNWNENGDVLLWSENNKDNTILFHVNGKGKISKLTSENIRTQLDDKVISTSNIRLSSDGRTVFFYRKKNNMQQNTDVEIWDTKDKWITPRKNSYDKNKSDFLLSSWTPEDNIVKTITDSNTSSILYRHKQPYALVWDALQYEPQYKQDTYVDLYVQDIKTGERKLIVEHLYLGNYDEYAVFSPNGLFVAYFKDHHWYLYDIKKGKTYNLTESIERKFYNESDNNITDKAPVAVPIWSEDEHEILLQDQYDIWLLNDKKVTNLTNGYSKGIHFKLSKANNTIVEKQLVRYSFSDTFTYNFNRPLLIETITDNLEKGFALLQKNKVKHLISSDLNYSNPKLFLNSNKFAYQVSSYKDSPSFYMYDLILNKSELLYQSNPTLQEFDLGKSEVINYTLPNGVTLKATLLYPSKFEASKKYPMIINIYNQNADKKFVFQSPNFYGYDGFKPINYVTNGYFVLLPNLSYEIGKPGESALLAVEFALKKAIENNAIDASRIGLIGHSFGGYESAFIATQSKLFKTAVAGAAVSDLQTWSHDMQGNDWNTDQLWRTESHQFRMGDNYYKLKDNYKRNSPLDQVEQLKMPLLLWTGKNDYNINWYQSVYLFMGMKRLNKEGKLVIFENEPHQIFKEQNQLELSKIIKDWFEKYLK